MPAIFVHVSDIHFGQERDERVHIHGDVKDQLVADAASEIRKLSGGTADGILVTGDIAYSGVREQYDEAAAWLDKLAAAIGSKIYQIQMVPGNHDLDRSKTSQSAQFLLDSLKTGDASDYEKVLNNDDDRAVLYRRFTDYGQFCEGYNCPLDSKGHYSADLRVELAPGRAIRFVRLNSSLLCTGSETNADPELIVSPRQFTIPRLEGEEMVVLIHHPLSWFKDSEDALRYLRSRARVLISGHEHEPKVHVDRIRDGADMMALAAGATVPFKSNDVYNFAYNILEFDWDEPTDSLAVTVHPRAWDSIDTCFKHEPKSLDGKGPRFLLGSPNFRAARVPEHPVGKLAGATEAETERDPILDLVPSAQEGAEAAKGAEVVPLNDEDYALVVLHFFRDLTEGERIRLLVDLEAIENATQERMTHAIERQLLDWLVRKGRLADIRSAMAGLIQNRNVRGH